MTWCDKCCERGKSRGFGSPEKENLAFHLQGCNSSTVPLENGMAGESLRKVGEVLETQPGGWEYYLQVCLHAKGQRVCLKERCSAGELAKDSCLGAEIYGAWADRMGWLQGTLCDQNQLWTWERACRKVIRDGEADAVNMLHHLLGAGLNF